MPADDALARWARAMTSRGDLERTRLAVSADAVVDRHGNGARYGQVVERIEGVEAIAAWLSTSPEGTVFEVSSPVAYVWSSPGGGGTAERVAEARYTVRGPGFDNQGSWRFSLAGDERLRWLEHAPDDLEGVERYDFGPGADETIS